MSRFFIDRPVFAWVVALVIMVAGGISMMTLPISQYPNIAPPAVAISASYPGASAKTVEDTVTQVIEQKMNGIDNLRYIESASDSNGGATVTITFEGGTDPNIAQVQVQNKLQLALPLLPQEVQAQGVRVAKATNNNLLVLGLVSEDGSMDNTDLSDYLFGSMQDPISRVTGVGDIQTFGSQYAMRIWLDPDKLVQYQLTAADVSTAIRSQNAQVSSGSLGGLPAVPGQMLTATIVTRGRLQTAEQFESILLRVNTDGSRVLLKDVARVELGSENYNNLARYNRRPAAGMAIRAAAGANALETVVAVKAKVDELSRFFPPGLKVVYPYDTSPFVRHSITEVVKTLVEAIILVFLVIYLFLQNWRATLIPTIAVPVVLLGTFGVLAAAGFTLNTLTLFGLVLAIGLLVDDAIVVVENVERVMEEEGLAPREATQKSMDQISGALVGIGLVLCAAFVPMAFFGNSTGVIYRQFAITIVSAVVLSVVVALILTPALCATMLKPVTKGAHHKQRGFFGWFNRVFDRTADAYAWTVGHLLRRSAYLLIVYGFIAAGVFYLFKHLQTGFLPDEDKGVIFTAAQLPPGSTREQSLAVVQRMEDYLLDKQGDSVAGVFGVAGFSFFGAGQNQVITFSHLKDWKERQGPNQGVKAIQGQTMGVFMQIKEAMAVAFAPPAVQELGNVSGFDLRLLDQAGLGHDALMNARMQLVGMASQNPALFGVRPNGLSDTPQFQLDIDEEKASALGLSIASINSELANIWGSGYVNDFLDKGRVKKVFIQGDAPFRMTPEDIGRWFIRNNRGDMVPYSAFASARWIMGSPKLERFNGAPSVAISGEAAKGHSSGEAMKIMEDLAKQLPAGIGYTWAGISYEERLSGSNSAALYGLALLMVFLCLAALYESWAIPISVMMDMPLGALGVLAAVSIRGLPNDVYFQIGLITIIGLSAKNAILVVEFAKERFDAGESLIDSAVFAVRQRLRPILMTSIAFGLGVLPLAFSTGPGAGSQNAIGTGVVGGAVTTTLLGLFFVPLYYVVVLKMFRVKPVKPKGGKAAGATVEAVPELPAPQAG
ncbi:efflux RND transporter permease subunit [Verrucomicrobium spinosum]|uniref:efflux RND transporter permease subunit n=1 Tax=Verrucomicrobium spinosum TaxID=2736 RepID=UPI000174509F|nr:efflux RND transporter permease subunit [Verrucomicrobium spinosum]